MGRAGVDDSQGHNDNDKADDDKWGFERDPQKTPEKLSIFPPGHVNGKCRSKNDADMGCLEKNSEKKKKKMKINIFYSKQIKCLLKISNNYFDDRSKIKNTKK